MDRLEYPLDTDFADAKYHFGNYLIFLLRIDRKILSPALLRVKYLQAKRDYLAKRDMTKIHKKQREEIKEAVREDLLKKVRPIPSFLKYVGTLRRKTSSFQAIPIR
jgi:DNA recombination-dependent growth factor C